MTPLPATDRAPENAREHVRQLVVVNERQAATVQRLERENGRLRQQVARRGESTNGTLFDG